MKKLLLLLVVLSAFLATAQDTQPGDLYEKNDLRTKNLGKEAKRTGNIYVALDYYQLLYDKDTTDIHLIVEMAELSRLTHNYIKGEKYYTKITKSTDFRDYPEAFFYLAQMEKANGKYPEAVKSLANFKKYGKDADDNLKKLAKTELDGCTYAVSIKDSVAKTNVFTLGTAINNPHIDFSPIPVSDNELIFGSLRENKEEIYTVSEYDSLPVPTRKLYLAKKQGDSWKFMGEFAGPFNDSEFDLANGTFSLDSSRFYFTRCTSNWQYKTVCQIYQSTRSDNGKGKWSEPELLNELVNMPDFTSSHPSMGRESKKNHEVMYFVSNREGSKGGMDIWFAEYDPKKKTFKKPRNAGTKINSVGDEMTPFYDIRAKTLYFSTDGRANIGGLDIFKAAGEGSTWTDPVNLGMPINSTADDLDFAMKPSAKGGFLVSNRKGGQSLYHETCCDDIYEFSYLKFITINCNIQAEDEKTSECFDKGEQISIYIADEKGKLMIQQVITDKCVNAVELRPGFDYVIEVKKEGYFTETTTVSTKNINESTTIDKKLKVRRKPVEPIVLKDVYFEFNSATLTPSSKIALDTTLIVLFQRYPDVMVELSAHTDSKGSDEYNMKLSQRRAESVVNYAISKGIRKEQMVPVGFGETRPIAPNEKPDGSDNPAGRDLNRRTEVRILGEFHPEEEEGEIIEEDTEKK